MNTLIYNFSVILLLMGLVLMVHYTTRVYYQQQIRPIPKPTPEDIYDSHVYNERPNKLFSNMFNNLGPWISRTGNPTDEELDMNSDLVRIKTAPLIEFK